MLDFNTIKYAVTQGGLALVCLTVFYFYRRDFITKQREDAADKAILISLVEKNTKASARLAAALERLRLVRAENDDD